MNLFQEIITGLLCLVVSAALWDLTHKNWRNGFVALLAYLNKSFISLFTPFPAVAYTSFKTLNARIPCLLQHTPDFIPKKSNSAKFFCKPKIASTSTSFFRSGVFSPLHLLKVLMVFGSGLTFLSGSVKKASLLLGIFVMVSFSGVNAATYTSTGTGGDWGSGLTWVGGTAPGAVDDVIIASGTTVTITGAITTNSLTINAGGSLIVNGTNTLTVTGDWVNNGLFTANNSTVVFSGNSDTSFGGISPSAFYDLTISKTNGLDDVIEFASAGTVSCSHTLNMSSGLLKFTSGTINLNCYSAFTINKPSGIWVSGATLNTGDFTIDNEGLVRISSGTATFGTQPGNSVHTQIDGAFEVTGGNVFVAGRLENTAGGTLATGIPSGLNISGGNVTLGTVGNGLSSAGTLDVSTNGAFNFVGGTIVFQYSSTATTPLDVALVLGSGSGAKNTTGGTFQLGNGSTPAGTLFRIDSDIPIDNLTLTANASVVVVGNDLTISNLLKMQGGNIDAATNGKKVILTNPDINAIARTSGYITGQMKRAIGNASGTTYLYPVGNGSNYTPLLLNFSGANNGGSITISSLSGDHGSIGSSLLNAFKSVDNYWVFENSGVLFGSMGGDFAFPDVLAEDGTYKVGFYNGSSWTYPEATASSLTSAGFSGVTSLSGTYSFALAECTAPTITLGTNPAVCSGATLANLSYSSTTGTPDEYRIDFDATANAAGLIDVVTTTLPASLIPLSVPAGIAPGTYNATLYVSNVADCESDGVDFTITVNPKPAITNITLTAICSGGTFTATPTNGTDGIVPAGTTYSWAAPTVAGITGTAAGANAANISGTLTNTTNAPINVVYTVTPTSGSCTGTPFTVAIIVNPIPIATATPLTQTFCSGGTTSIAITSNVAGTTFSWTIADSPSGSITGATAGTGNSIAQTLVNTTPLPATLTYTVTPTANACPGTPVDVVITVNPRPVLSGPITLTVCSGVAFTYTAGSNTPGTTFSWTRAAAIGISNGPNAGSGDVNETLINTTGTPRTARYIYTLMANGCSSSPQYVDVTVTPSPTLSSTLTPDPVCSNSVFSYHAVPTYAATTMNWSRAVVAGISNPASAGIGDISETLINTTTADIPVTYNYSLNNSGCVNNQSVIIIVKAYPTVGGVGDLEFCHGESVPVQVFTGPVGGTTFTWTNSEPAIGLGSSGTGSLPSFVASNSGSTPLTATINVRPSANGCIGANTNFTIKVWPAPIGGTLSGSATVCTGSNSGTLILSGKRGLVSKWQSSTDGGSTWTDIANTGITQTYLNLTATTQYRAEIKNGSCPAVYQTPAIVTVNSGSVGGTVSSGQTVCSGSNSGTLTLGGHTGNVLNWQYSTDNGTTWLFLANTTTTQLFNNLTTTTLYRAVVQNGTCTPVESAFATITVDPISVGGLANGGTSVCAGTNSVTLNLTSFTGFVVKWQSTTNNWATVTDIANTSTSLTITNLVASTKYRAVVQSGTCPPANSVEAAITVDLATVGGAVGGDATVCSGTNSTILTLSGHTGTVLRWESSTDNWATVTAIANTTATYTASNLTAATKYRAVVKSGGCAEANSTEAVLTVDAAPVGGTISGGVPVCSGDTSGLLTLTGYTGTIVKWQSSVSPFSSWTDIANTAATYTSGPLTQETQFRAILQNGVCSAVNSGVGTVAIGVAPVLVTHDTAPVCAPLTANLTLPAITAGSTLPVGTVLSYYANDGITPVPDPTQVNADTYYIKATTPANCFVIQSVVVSVYTSLGAVIFDSALSPTVCKGSAPVTYNATATNAFTLVYSLDAASDVLNDINPSTGQVTFGSSYTGTINITATATGCGGSTSQAIYSVIVSDLPTITSFTSSLATICAGDPITLSATSTGGTTIKTFASGVITLNQTVPESKTSPGAGSITNLVATGGETIATTDIIEVTLNITHNNNGHLDIFLVAPNGGCMLLSSDNGRSGDNYSNATLITGATPNVSSLNGVDVTISGIYGIEGNVSTLAPQNGANNGGGSTYGNAAVPQTILLGSPINGNWQLRVYDDTNGTIGTLDNWSIKISKTVPNTLTTVFSGPGTVGTIYSGATPLTASQTLTPPVGTNVYTATTTENGCTTSKTVTVTVNPKPTPIITANYCVNRPKVNLSIPGSYPTIVWSTGATNVNTIDVDVAGKFFVTVTDASGCTGSDTIMVAEELVINGNFELGPTFNSTPGPNKVFDSDYGFRPPPVGTLGYYGIGKDARPYYPPGFRGAHDHTNGSGYYMIVDGTDSSKVVWQQDIIVQPNTDYYFAAWAINIYRTNGAFDPNLRFRINGQLIGTSVLLNQFTPTDLNPWVFRFYGMWNSGSNTTARVQVRDLTPGLQQNDFGLDDISFGTLADVPFTVTITNNSPACAGNIIDLSTTLTGAKPPIIYSWTGPNGFTSTSDHLTINNPTPLQYGTYTVTAQDFYGCDPVSDFVVVTNSSTPMIPNQAVTVCNGVPFDITPLNGVPDAATVVPNPTTYTWAAPTGTGFTGGSAQPTPQTSIGQTLTNTTTAPAIAVYTVTPTAGTCTGASFTVTVTVKPTATANAGADQSICSDTSGATVTLAGIVGGDATGGIWGGGTGTYTPDNTTLGANYTPSAAEITAGSVTLTLTTTGGCTIVTSDVHITIRLAPVLAGSLTPVKCFGQNNGAIDLTVTGGGASPTFAWAASNGGIVPPAQATNEDLNGLVAGSYSVTVTATNGCPATATFDIAQPTAALQVVATTVNLSCGETANGGATLVVTGGTSPYSYAWTASNGGIIPAGQEVVQNPAGLVAGTYHYTVTDANLCSVTNQVDVVQGADTAPVITTCPPEYTVEGCSVAAITGLPYSNSQVAITAADFINAGGVATDNCAITSYTYQDVQIGACTIEVTRVFILGDASSLTTSCQQKIHIVDTNVPGWATVPGSLDRTLECNDLIGFGMAQSLSPVSTEICNTDNVVKILGAFFPSGSCSQAGTYTNKWISTDACGKASPIFAQKITIVDTSIPTWVTSAEALDVTLSCDDAAGLADAMSLMPEAFDLCIPTVPVLLASSSGFVAGTVCGQSGWYTRTWQAKDDCGNTSVPYTQTITIEDKTKPVWVNPPGDLDRFLECSDAAGLAAAQALAPVASDNCDTNVLNIIKSVAVVASSGTCPQAETITYTWTVTDDCGNMSNTYTQVINIDDNTPPQIFCPPNTAIGYGDSTDPDINSDLGKATATDNCDAIPEITYSDVIIPGSCVGSSTIQRTWRAEDACDNFSTCVQQITVQDIVSPIISCPSSVNTPADPAQTYATITLPDPTLSDNVTPPATLLLNLKWTMTAPTLGAGNGIIAANFKFNIGTTTITYSVTDDCGSPAECSFTVTVTPNDPPDITCPANIQQNVDAGLCSAIVTIIQPTATGSGVTITGVRSDGKPLTDPYPVGVTTITWTATNSTGSDSCPQTVTVIDNEPPTFTLPATELSYCVNNIISAVYNPTPNLLIVPEYDDLTTPRPEYYQLTAAGKLLDLDPIINNFDDNCCADNSLIIHWRIVFAPTPNPATVAHELITKPAITGQTGQPSAYGDILFPGDGVTFTDIVHRIYYWLEDCNGNPQGTPNEQFVNITIKPRPNVIKVP